MSDAVSRLNEDGGFISLWELFSQIGKAERVHEDEAARILVTALENDPTGISHMRRRDESGLVLPLDMEGRLHLLRQLSIFASQGTLFDADDTPNHQAQPTFEGFGAYAADVYPFLSRNDVALSYAGNDGVEGRAFPDGRHIPAWMVAYDGQPWLSRYRVTKILMEGTADADLHLPQCDDVFWKWDAALSDAIMRESIAVRTVANKPMLWHADVSAWCEQHGYTWPLESPATQPDDTDTDAPCQPQGPKSTPAMADGVDNGLTKREKQIRAIEAMAGQLGLPRLRIPDGGKAALLKQCKAQHPDLFGGGNSPFNDAWKVASKTNRLAMANKDRYAGR